MGLLVHGKWVDRWYDTEGHEGHFVRSAAKFRNWVTADGSAGPSGRNTLWTNLDSKGLPKSDIMLKYCRANIDPSERYVMSVAGSARYRLRADQSGFSNLVLTGDWIQNGYNAGCIEASAWSGIQAANVILGRSLNEGVIT